MTRKVSRGSRLLPVQLRLCHPGRTWLDHLTTFLQVVAVPIAVVVIGGNIQRSISEASTAKDYVALAIGILRADPKAAPSPDPLRDWALAVFQAKGFVAPSPQVLEQLKNHQLRAVEFTSAIAWPEAVTKPPPIPTASPSNGATP